MPARNRCIDCEREGITTRRKIAIGRTGKPVPGPRCVTHNRAKRRARSQTAWAARIKDTYDLTADEFDQILAYQRGTCAICQRATGLRKRLSVDHDHATGFVRGLLCGPCNRDVLGHLRDDPAALQRAIDYLTNPPAFAVVGQRIAPIEKETL